MRLHLLRSVSLVNLSMASAFIALARSMFRPPAAPSLPPACRPDKKFCKSDKRTFWPVPLPSSSWPFRRLVAVVDFFGAWGTCEYAQQLIRHSAEVVQRAYIWSRSASGGCRRCGWIRACIRSEAWATPLVSRTRCWWIRWTTEKSNKTMLSMLRAINA